MAPLFARSQVFAAQLPFARGKRAHGREPIHLVAPEKARFLALGEPLDGMLAPRSGMVPR